MNDAFDPKPVLRRRGVLVTARERLEQTRPELHGRRRAGLAPEKEQQEPAAGRRGSGAARRGHAIYERIAVTGRRIVSVRLTPSAYAHGLALALPTKVALARPTGFGRTRTHSGFLLIPIEGAAEWEAGCLRIA